MSLFKKNITTTSKSNTTPVCESIKEVSKPVEEWIWVEGYKGTKNNMTCMGYKYVLNQEHIHNENVELCHSGFHFCINLKDVFGHYSPLGNNIRTANRYFKVKALVRKIDYESALTDKDSKCVATKIILTEEVSYQALKEAGADFLPWVESEEDWTALQNIYDPKLFYAIKFINKCKMSGINETLATILFNHSNLELQTLKRVLDLLTALNESKVSTDMKVYLLLEEIKQPTR